MKTHKTSGQRIKSILKKIGLYFLIIFVGLNIYILISGKSYIYSAIGHTYLVGETGPSIYDLDKFPKRTVNKGNHPEKWVQSKAYVSTIDINKEFERYNKKYESSAFLIFKNDSLLFERYWGEHNINTVSNSFSAAKTVVALLIAIAVEEGKIKSIDEPVSNYIPEFKRVDLSIITIKDLLLMASGLDWTESGKNPFSDNAASYYGTNLYELATSQKRIGTPGENFIYQSGNSQLLGIIIENATGKNVSEYCSEKLWTKMGMESDAYWSLDKEDGLEKSFCCLYATARDFGKLGKLIAHRGSWNGIQLIPSWYFDDMKLIPNKIQTQDELRNYQYAYHIWTYLGYESPIYYCRGILGQYIISIPEENVVIVRLGQKRAGNIKFNHDKSPYDQNLKKIGHTEDFLKYVNFATQIIEQAESK